MKNGYFIIPRSVTSDPRYQGARLKYKHVLHIIFENVAFATTTHAIGTEVIKIEIGQFCVSERRLVDLCNDGVKFEEDMVDKNIVRRAIHFFEKCEIVNHKVNHGKNVITITVPEFYERKKIESEPQSEPKVNQKRTTKEEVKEVKELKTNLPNLPSEVLLSVAEKPGRSVGSLELRKELEDWLLRVQWRERQADRPEDKHTAYEFFSQTEAIELFDKFPPERILEVKNMMSKKRKSDFEKMKSEKGYFKMALFRGWK